MVAAITPIRGQLTFVPTPTPPRVVRGAGVYAAPCEAGVVIGATMEPGRRDLERDPGDARRQVAGGLPGDPPGDARLVSDPSGKAGIGAGQFG